MTNEVRPPIALRDTDDVAARHPVFRSERLHELIKEAIEAGRPFFDEFSNPLTTVTEVLKALLHHDKVYAAPRGTAPPLPEISDPANLTIDLFETD